MVDVDDPIDGVVDWRFEKWENDDPFLFAAFLGLL